MFTSPGMAIPSPLSSNPPHRPAARSTLWLIAFSGLAAAATGSVAEAVTDEQLEMFERRVRPLLIQHCLECHGRENKAENGLRVDSRESLIKGGDSGPAVVPAQPDESLLVKAIRRVDDKIKAMPPEDPLDEDQVRTLIKWIRNGAHWPKSSPSLIDHTNDPKPANDLWSLQPIADVKPPTVKVANWPRTEIDQFVLARLEANGLLPLPDAGPRTLVRRLYFDLIGLPPPLEVVHDYLADRSPQRYERLVDNLLASPRFGERWGRHWLDLVRFAESSGKEFNFSYPHAWPYRNYVIDSLCADKPYDRFLQEQLAGDLMPVDPAAGADEQVVATGFLALGVKRHNTGTTEFRADIIDDQIDVTMRTVLGLSVACARCHDHKFDPVPSQDYYALAGIFQSTDLLYGTIQQKYSNHPTALIPIGPDAKARHEAAEQHDATIKKTTESLAESKKQLEEQQKKLDAQAAEGTSVPNQDAATEQQVDESNQEPPAEVIEKLQIRIAELEQEKKCLEENRPPKPQYGFAARDSKEPENAKIARRGNPNDLGKEVPRGFLNCVGSPSEISLNQEQSGRLELAHWLTHPQNPLTARVMVNRIWHHLFGQGLVKTVDNFGSLGDSPTHPQLLDRLARQFMDKGWSIKQTIRQVVLSRTYQLRSGWKTLAPSGDSDAYRAYRIGMSKDPGNQFLWRMSPRRLEAEALRDAIFAVSSQLDLSRPRGSTVTALGDRLVRDIVLDKLNPPSNHRSVYLAVIRDYPPKFFELFDFPSPDMVSGRRSLTTVPLQDLFLQNDSTIIELARSAARRLTTEFADDSLRIDNSFERTLSRPPTDTERRAVLAFLEKVRADLGNQEEPDPDIGPWAGLFEAIFGSAEFRQLVDAD